MARPPRQRLRAGVGQVSPYGAWPAAGPGGMPRCLLRADARRLLVQPSTELDPHRPRQKRRQPAAGVTLRVRQQHGNESETAGAMATRRSIALRISSFCHGPVPIGPMNSAHVAQSTSAASRGLCQGSLGARFQVSTQGWKLWRVRLRSSSSTAGLAIPLWERNTSNCCWRRPGPRCRSARHSCCPC
jgi:hypothetical protein